MVKFKITTKGGLLYYNGKVIDLPEADHVARKHGFSCAEQLVKHLQMKWIDAADYETLLRKWRFCESGDPIFQGAVGRYYQEEMNRKKAELTNTEQVAVSKRVGWTP